MVQNPFRVDALACNEFLGSRLVVELRPTAQFHASPLGGSLHSRMSAGVQTGECISLAGGRHDAIQQLFLREKPGPEKQPPLSTAFCAVLWDVAAESGQHE